MSTEINNVSRTTNTKLFIELILGMISFSGLSLLNMFTSNLISALLIIIPTLLIWVVDLCYPDQEIVSLQKLRLRNINLEFKSYITGAIVGFMLSYIYVQIYK